MSVRSFSALFAVAALACAPACHRDESYGIEDLSGAGDDLQSPVPVPDLSGPITIEPATVTLVLDQGQPIPTQLFTAKQNGTTLTLVSWSTNRAELGAMELDGTYAPRGDRGGKAMVVAKYQGLEATAEITLQIRRVENGDPAAPWTGPAGPGGYGGVGGDGPGGALDATQVAALHANPIADPAIKWLYPYDGTVFPRGLLAPLLQWSAGGHAFTAARVQLSSASGTFEYDGYFARPSATRPFVNLPIPQASWTQMNYSASGDKVNVKVTLLEGATAYGPLTLTWTIAPATLRGVIYYNSYGTKLVTNSAIYDMDGDPIGAGTLAIRPGTTDPTLVAGTPSNNNTGCRVCHVVSRDGARLITQTGNNYDASRLFELKSGGDSDAVIGGQGLAFPAMYPDGSMYLSSGRSWDGAQTAASRLYALPGGGAIAASGLPADLKAATPVFSSDGKLVAFNLWGGPGADQRSLATLAFDPGNTAFSGLTTVYTPATAGHSAAWPSFLPSQTGIVFEEAFDTAAWGETRLGNKGTLKWVDLASKTVHGLDRLNGQGYLPVGAGLHADDTRFNYEPTVNPIASGGYAWVIFTSRRMYGNVATIDPFSSNPESYDWKNQITTKKLWVAAIDLNAAPGTDPSHPAFYLPAQELFAGNSRAYWSVEPCRADGFACETGDECCGGYCREGAGTVDGGGGGALRCDSTMPTCAMENEKCTTDADCCQPAVPEPSIDPMPGPPNLICVNNYCVQNMSPPVL